MADITMPKMGFDMEQGTIVRWLKQVGDEIKKGEPIAEIETDKVTIEIEAFDSGTLTQIVADEGAVVPVGDRIAVLGGNGAAPASAGPETQTAQQGASANAAEPKAGEGGDAASSVAQQTQAAASGNGGAQTQAAPAPAASTAAPRPGYGSDTVAEAETQGSPTPPAEAVATAGVGERMEPVGAGSDGAHVKASPVAKRLASEKQVNIAQISGSGPGGRIVRRDVEEFLSSGAQAAPQPAVQAPAAAPAPVQPTAAPVQAAPAPQAQPRPGTRREPLSRLRQTIGRRLAQSKVQAPHYYVTVAIDMGAAMALRKQLNAMEGVKISVNDMVVKACALALKQYPALNASFAEDSIDYFEAINISIAVATDNGLLAPAVTDVDKKSLGVLAAESRELIERTRSGKATPDELQRGTFTVSNLGMYDVESFVAIINPPQAAIVAIGSAAETPVVKDGQVVIAPIMKATISADHRISDGVVGAQYLQAVRTLLEEPMRLLI